jgi:hypothetical protein
LGVFLLNLPQQAEHPLLIPNHQSLQRTHSRQEVVPRRRLNICHSGQVSLLSFRSKDGKYKWSELAKELYIGSNR